MIVPENTQPAIGRNPPVAGNVKSACQFKIGIERIVGVIRGRRPIDAAKIKIAAAVICRSGPPGLSRKLHIAAKIVCAVKSGHEIVAIKGGVPPGLLIFGVGIPEIDPQNSGVGKLGVKAANHTGPLVIGGVGISVTVDPAGCPDGLKPDGGCGLWCIFRAQREHV